MKKRMICYLLIGAMLAVLPGCGSAADTAPKTESRSEAAEEKAPEPVSVPETEPAAEQQSVPENEEKPALRVPVSRIQANGCYTYGLTREGTLIASAAPDVGGDNVMKTLTEYPSWTGIVNFSSGAEAIAAVREDGTVVMCGGLVDEMEYCEFGPVAEWKDVVQVAVGKRHVVALKADGSVEMAGRLLTQSLQDTEGFVQVEAGCEPMGVKADGTVTVWSWNWSDPIDEVSTWTDVVSVSGTWNHIAALRADGTVVACGNNDFGQCDVESWTEITAVSTGCDFTVGLKADGTVMFCGSDGGAIDVSGWSDIVEIDAGYDHVVGLCADGTVVSAGQNYMGQCNTAGWKLG